MRRKCVIRFLSDLQSVAKSDTVQDFIAEVNICSLYYEVRRDNSQKSINILMKFLLLKFYPESLGFYLLVYFFNCWIDFILGQHIGASPQRRKYDKYPISFSIKH